MKMVAAAISIAAIAAGCGECEECTYKPGADGEPAFKVDLVQVAPGHFHAALVQNRTYPEVSEKVLVFAPKGPELDAHLKLIEQFNTREKDPTAWKETVYTGDDFLEKALECRDGLENTPVAVFAGKNCDKTGYVLKCVEAGYNIFSDKPMAITPDRFDMLEKAFALADENGLMIYDIMTERFEITTILQRELAMTKGVYGEQEKGTPENPAVTKESVHHFCKLVNGKPLQRPGWYYDTDQQGEAIMDVTTHLTDLVQWETFPEVVLKKDDVKMLSARIWPTAITAADYKTSTGLDEWPEFLKKDLDANGVLQCKANGEFTYQLKGVNAKVSVLWNFMPQPGGGDTHYSLMRGTKSELIIRQNKDTNFRQRLFVKPREGVDAQKLGEELSGALERLCGKYPQLKGDELGVKFENGEWVVSVPKACDIGHEAHFSQVTRNFLKYLAAGELPEWEKPNMLVKYYTLTLAYKAAHGDNK